LPLSWLAPRHLAEVLEIDGTGVDPPHSRSALESLLRGRHTLGRVLTEGQGGPVLAYWICTLLPRGVVLETIAVHAAWRRRSLGRRMLGQLVCEQSAKGRPRVVTAVREQNLPAQLFLHGCGFRAIGVLRRYYVTEDAYHFMILSPACGGS